MRINFHGAAQTVTGSQHLLEINGATILLECGMYQGRREETYFRNQNFPFDPRKIDAVILSHAHIDHSGNLPHLIKNGYTGPIYATHATADLADVMLRDSVIFRKPMRNLSIRRNPVMAANLSSRFTPWLMPGKWLNTSDRWIISNPSNQFPA